MLTEVKLKRKSFLAKQKSHRQVVFYLYRSNSVGGDEVRIFLQQFQLEIYQLKKYTYLFRMNILNDILEFPCNSIYLERRSLILSSNDPFSRSTRVGHITASGLVIQDNKVLLILHPYIKQWIQPGGHIDDGETPVEAAIREVYEETGLVCISEDDCPDPIDINIHEIPANSKKGEEAHLHIDLLYRLSIIREEAPLENLECTWFSFEDVDNLRLKRLLS